MLALGSGPSVLACGAWLKNAACVVAGDGRVLWSDNHGDLGDPDSCIALERSVQALLDGCEQVAAVAHDLHPDFFSSQLACRLAEELGVPSVAVQHHHAHIAAVMAEHHVEQPVIGLALDGVGLGTDGLAWGGELLQVAPDGDWQRLAHLRALPLPGGDAAAREPWRMAAALLHEAGRGDEIAKRFAPLVGDAAARTVQAMLVRDLNCPRTTSAGRWFDAAAGALGLSLRQAFEAEAAIALEKRATDWLAQHEAPDPSGLWLERSDGSIDLMPVLACLLASGDGGSADELARDAALFHLVLADALAQTAIAAAREAGIGVVALGGGCFFNRLLSQEIERRLAAAGLAVLRPVVHSCGDAGLALGQAWVARRRLQQTTEQGRSIACA